MQKKETCVKASVYCGIEESTRRNIYISMNLIIKRYGLFC